VPFTTNSQFLDGFITIGNPSVVTFNGIPFAQIVSQGAIVFDRVCIVLRHEKEGGSPLSFL
jgi:hypothetical protein